MDYSLIGDIDQFVGKTVKEECGPEPEAVDPNSRGFRKLLNFQQQEEGAQICFGNPKIAFYDGQKFDEQLLKTQKLDQIKAEKRTQAAQKANEQLLKEKQAEQAVQDKNKKKQAKPTTPGPDSLLNQRCFETKLQALTQSIYEQLTNNLENTIDIQQEITKQEKIDELSYRLQMPAKSILSFTILHQPASF